MKGLSVLMTALAGSLLYGQTTFEVASVKRTPPPVDMTYMRSSSFGGPGSPRPTRWTAENVSLMTLISRAYGLNPNQISGPGFLNEPGFDIDARVAEGATRDQFRLMLQD